MDEKIIDKLTKILKHEEKSTYVEELLSEIYSEVNQINQKQDEILRLLKK